MAEHASDRRSLTGNERRTWRSLSACLWWTVAFAVTFVAGGQVFKYADWAPEGPLAWGLSLVPLIPGAMAFLSFLRFYREADEMIRSIFAEGMLFSFGAVMVFWGAIQLPEHVWLPKVRADIVVSVMLVSFCIGIMRAQWRRK